MQIDKYIEQQNFYRSITKMEDSTNDANTDNLLDLVSNHWYLDKESEDMVCEAIIEPPHHIFMDTEFNDHHRLFVPIKLDKDTDESYLAYIDRLYYYYPTLANRNNWLLEYETWATGRTPDGAKLFKWLKKQGMEQDHIEQLTTSRNTSALYCVVSKNPMDWLFMSTNQSFSSCMSLNSDYRAAFYMGIPEYMVDPNKYLVYITKGKMNSYQIKGYHFRHFRYINRSIAVVTDKKALAMVNYYPSRVTSYGTGLNKLGIDIVDRSYNRHGDRVIGTWQSNTLQEAPELRFAGGELCAPYHDHGVSYKPIGQRSRKYYHDRTASGSRMNIHWGNGFEAIRSIDDFIDPKATCASCDCSWSEDELTWINDDQICDDCRSEYYRYCQDCDEYHWHESGSYVGPYDDFVCESCLDWNYFYCEECGCYYLNDEKTMIGEDAYCEECAADNSFACVECQGIFHNDDDYGHNCCESCCSDLQDRRDDLVAEINEKEEEINNINTKLGEQHYTYRSMLEAA
jgi:hypothetical protein